jgi:hypothetical protein
VRRLVLACLCALVVAAGGTGAATAAPTEVRINVQAHAQWLSPSTIIVPVTYICDPILGTAFIQVRVTQADETLGDGFGFTSAPCTGSRADTAVTVCCGPYTPGDAIAFGFVFAGGFFDQHTRRIQIQV